MRKNPLLLVILSAITACSEDVTQGDGCLSVSEGVTTCPTPNQVKPGDLFLPGQCGLDIVGVHDNPPQLTEITGQDGVPFNACCYTVDIVDPDPDSECIVGRPYREGAEMRSAPLCARRVAAAAAQAERAGAWARAGAAEHASVAAFSRLSLQLMANGAPSELLRAVHQAALDEIRHAKACWKMARRLGGGEISAGQFPFGAAIDPNVDLATLAAEAAREGCLGETLGAAVARAAADAAGDPEVRQVLRGIASEEARHAALSYRIVAWALRVGGAKARQAVVEAFEGPCPRVDTRELALRAQVNEALLARAAAECEAEVIRPAALALMAA